MLNPMQEEVLILLPYINGYRVGLLEGLRYALSAGGVNLLIAAGRASGSDKEWADSAEDPSTLQSHKPRLRWQMVDCCFADLRAAG